MTLIGLVLLILLFGIVLAVGTFLDALPGALSIIGFVAILCAFIFFAWLLKKRALPICRNGTCRVKDYEGLPVQMNEHGAKFRCRCGDVYRLEGNRFLFIGKDGREAVHKVRKHTGGAWGDLVASSSHTDEGRKS
jgi:hypothetical protein